MEPAVPHQFIKVRATTNARKEAVVRIRPDTFQIAVHELPKNNAANLRITELLARTLHIPITSLSLIKGHHHPSKTFIIR